LDKNKNLRKRRRRLNKLIKQLRVQTPSQLNQPRLQLVKKAKLISPEIKVKKELNQKKPQNKNQKLIQEIATDQNYSLRMKRQNGSNTLLVLMISTVN
jgi:hypothetical protein